MNAPAAQSGLDDVDFWIGGLAEDGMVFGGLLGSSFNYVFEQHLEALQNADRFYYLTRTQGLNIMHQLENNSFSELVLRNTDADNLHADIFANPDIVIDLEADPTTWPAELLVQSGPRYRYDGAEHVVIHATAGNDDVAGGEGDDSVWGHEGNDIVEGGMGNDVLHGGHGDDTITDVFGDDTIHAGSGNDRVNAGSGLDLIFGGTGTDFVLHGNEITQSFAGGQADFVRGGNANDILTGNEDTDWLEGAGGHDLVQGDNAFTLMTDPNGGDEVLDGGSGNDDHDAEGGDDIMLNNGIDRHAGMLGFDWVTHQHDPFAGESDLDVSVFQPLEVQYMRSRFMNVEGLSGWDKPDVLRGSSAAGDPTYPDGSGHILTQEHIDQVGGLRDLLGGGAVPPYATGLMATSEANDIILGGANSDLIEGRAGDDYIDGNAALEVVLRHVNGEEQPSMTGFQARVFSGAIDPEDLEIVRRIVVPTGQADIVDTAYYGDVRANYLITRNGDGTWRVEHLDTDSPVTTGVDTVRGIERLQFTDGTFNLANISNLAAYGTINLSPLDPEQGEQIVATPAFTDPQGINALDDRLHLAVCPRADGRRRRRGCRLGCHRDGGRRHHLHPDRGRDRSPDPGRGDVRQDNAGATRVDRLAGDAAGGQCQRRTDGSRHRQHGAARRRRPDRQRPERPRRHDDVDLPPPVAGRRRHDVHRPPRRHRSDVHGHRCPGRPTAAGRGRLHRRPGHG